MGVDKKEMRASNIQMMVQMLLHLQFDFAKWITWQYECGLEMGNALTVQWNGYILAAGRE